MAVFVAVFFLAGSSGQQHPNISELEELTAVVPRGPRSSIPGDAAGTATLAHGTPEQRLVGAGAGSFAVGAVQCPWRGGIPSASLPRGDGEKPVSLLAYGAARVLFLPSVSLPNFKPAVPLPPCSLRAEGISTSGGPYPLQHGFCGLEKEMR